MSKEKEILRKRVNSLIRRRRLIEVQKLIKNEEIKPWGRDAQAKVCSLLHTFFFFFLMIDYFKRSFLYLLDFENSFLAECYRAAWKSSSRTIN